MGKYAIFHTGLFHSSEAGSSRGSVGGAALASVTAPAGPNCACLLELRAGEAGVCAWSTRG